MKRNNLMSKVGAARRAKLKDYGARDKDVEKAEKFQHGGRIHKLVDMAGRSPARRLDQKPRGPVHKQDGGGAGDPGNGVGVGDNGPGDTGAGVQIQVAADRSVHAFGTFGAAGSVQMEVSNEPSTSTVTSWVVAHDPQGNNLALTAAKIESVSEASNRIRPNCTAGDGTTSITVALFTRSTV